LSLATRIGPYRILRLINRGGQGSVYLGYDGRLQRRVAIKIYPLPSRRAARRRCLREARMVAALHSPKVVQVFDLRESREHLALVMEYVPGCDLEEFLSAVRPTLHSVLAIATDIAGALAVMRQHRIVHGDLKAGNILISDSGRIKLTDFGIARDGGAISSEGSRSAVSPEQYLGKPLDIRSDLFSLGCLLYRMLGGTHPFCRGNRLDPQLLLEGEPRPLGELVPPDLMPPPELFELVRALLKKDPAERPANTHQVRRALRQIARDVPMEAGGGLLREARPCFRRESREDIPPQIPPDLLRAGRSRLEVRSVPGELASLVPWPRGRFGQRLTAAGITLLAVGAVALVLNRWPTAVYVEEPQIRVNGAVELPGEISPSWLARETLESVRAGLGPLKPTGPGAPLQTRILYAPGAAAEHKRDRVPAERLAIGLRCSEELCVYSITRERRNGGEQRQVVLFPDMPLDQWRRLMRGAVLSLYR